MCYEIVITEGMKSFCWNNNEFKKLKRIRCTTMEYHIWFQENVLIVQLTNILYASVNSNPQPLIALDQNWSHNQFMSLFYFYHTMNMFGKTTAVARQTSMCKVNVQNLSSLLLIFHVHSLRFLQMGLKQGQQLIRWE